MSAVLKEIIFRQLEESDSPGLYAVALEAWQYTYRAIFDPLFIENFIRQHYSLEEMVALFPRIRSGDMFFHVAEHESQIVGYCNMGLTPQGAELFRIYLLPSYIGQSIGRRLLQLGEAFVMAHGMNSYFCSVHKDNELGQRFYFRNGFRHIPERDHDDEWYMEKTFPA